MLADKDSSAGSTQSGRRPDHARIAQDIDLARRIAAGDPRAEGGFVKDNIIWMRPLARKFVSDGFSVDDVVQEAFASAFRSIGSYEGRSTLKTWLHRITVNVALMRIRKIKRLAECELDEHLPQFDQEGYRLEAPWGAIASPDDILAQEEKKSLVLQAIAKLPENYRIVIQMRDIEERCTAEVADLLELTESNVKVRLHRARSALKSLLEPVLRV